MRSRAGGGRRRQGSAQWRVGDCVDKRSSLAS
uniref:Uncharacterized protein n=1 Tax=Arundo donax TaxID=35708 RepID=A0A0A8ZGA1_ARUDO